MVVLYESTASFDMASFDFATLALRYAQDERGVAHTGQSPFVLSKAKQTKPPFVLSVA